MKLKVMFLIFMNGFFLISCAHQEVSRLPASEGQENLEKSNVSKGVLSYQSLPDSKQQSPSKFCGYLDSAESNRNAVDENDAIYVINVDCRNSPAQNSNKGLVKLDRSNLNSNQKGWIPRWRAAAAKKHNTSRSLPYLCFNGEVDRPVCNSSGVSYSELKSVLNITSLAKTYQSWK